MIKRVKWNFVYDDDGAESESGTSSDELSADENERKEGDPGGRSSSDEEYEDTEVLRKLLFNDPTLRISDADALEEEDEPQMLPEEEDGEVIQVLKTEKLKETKTRVCTLCKQKRLLNDKDVEIHVASKKHKKAEKRLKEDKTCDSLNEDRPERSPYQSKPKEKTRKKKRYIDQPAKDDQLNGRRKEDPSPKESKKKTRKEKELKETKTPAEIRRSKKKREADTATRPESVKEKKISRKTKKRSPNSAGGSAEKKRKTKHVAGNG
ncbi:hypothetical protein NDN08_003968 [Rhodosorus marinus]|uniref:U1-type domain-containing protein n=1 Tax=Rhodosorus marinus TaxID=101924 RepID=A0AAV8UKQ3_9RHOD|nr:hypothetical protein NDN08_003968 [Rhodosorus marinus]